MSQLKDDLSNRVSLFLEAQGYQLVELNVIHRRGEDTIQMLIDRPNGGITIKECAVLHREIFNLLDDGQTLMDEFCVEVSSPGIDRPLCTYKDFLRNIGKAVQISLNDVVDDQKEHHGVIKALEGGDVVIDSNQIVHRIPLSFIQKAQLII